MSIISEDIDHEYTDEIVCPHCGSELSDSWDYADAGKHQCGECKNEYSYSRDTSISYLTEKL